MAIIGPIVSNDWFFFVTIFALAALMILFEAKRREPAAGGGFALRSAARPHGAPAANGCGWVRCISFRSCSSRW